MMTMMFSFFLILPLVAFMIIVAPIWIVFHYRSKRQVSDSLSREEYEMLNRLSEKADSLSQRVQTLEKILDAESPNWRSHYE